MIRANYLSVILLGLLYVQEGIANEVTSQEVDSTIQQELFLDVILNQSNSNILGHFLQQGDQLYISTETLQDLKLTLPADLQTNPAGYYLLEDIPSVKYKYDNSNQKIYLDVDIKALKRTSYYPAYTIIEPVKLDPAQERPGALFNYDFYSQYSEDYFNLSGTHEFRVFGLGEGGILNLSSNYSYTKTDEDSELNALILDTYWQRDLPEKMLTIRVGDDQSKPLSW